MATDRNGRALRVGDKVFIECEVDAVLHETAVRIVPKDGAWPVYGAALAIPSRLVELAVPTTTFVVEPVEVFDPYPTDPDDYLRRYV